MTTPGSLWARAVRHFASILVVARGLVRARVPDFGMDLIARRAGVTVGTRYRDFPTKPDRFGPVVSEFFRDVADDAEAALARVRAGECPARTFNGFLYRVLQAGASNQTAKTAAEEVGAVGENSEADTRVTVNWISR